MSNEYCLPISVKILPHRWITTAIVVIHSLPPLVLGLTVDIDYLWLLSVIVLLSLAFELRKQRLACDAEMMVVTTTGEWLLFHQADRYHKVQFVDGADFDSFLLLLLAQNRRKFRLVVSPGEQNRSQLHRLRVLLRNHSTDPV